TCEERGEERRIGGERARGCGNRLLASETAGDRQRGNDQEEPAGKHRDAERRVVPIGVAGEATEGGTVVVPGRRVGVRDLRETVRSWVEDRSLRGIQQHRSP